MTRSVRLPHPFPPLRAGWCSRLATEENVRDISAATDIPMTTGHYLRSMRQLTNQWTPHTYRDERRQRLYLKDIDCPPEWRESLQKVIHPSLFYLNENVNVTGSAGGHRDDDLFRADAAAAPAGDLMSSLPEEMRAENLMCYIGHEGTFTPAHREMCASLGQNIMVEASVDGAGDKAGSSIWFMTESKDREVVREYFMSMLGHDIEIEKHFAQINAWKKAPFDVYIVEQRVGDFILIPPLAAHQVWNRGTRTIKVAWNRTTVETLDLALHEALPKARLVCRDEQYRNKAIIYFTLEKYHRELKQMEDNAELAQLSFMGIGHEIVRNSARAKQLAGDFKRLFGLFTEVLVDETFAFKEKDVEFLPFDSYVTCSYCRSNIFNRFLTCKHCVRTLANEDDDAYDVCMECYSMGRSCACLSGLQWCEQWSWSGLVDRYEAWRAMVIANDGYIDIQTSPQSFEVARLKSGKKTVAQICQEALRRRPWKDITKQDREEMPSDSEPGDSDEKAKKKRKRNKKKGELRRCHVCCHQDYSYRVHLCTNPECSEGYCYGVLYRAFDMMPQRVLEDENWQCPKCRGICSCGGCRRSGKTNAYTPKSTMLGHDTRPIADDRSVEALVDFRVPNLSWLKAVGEESRSNDSRRMQRLREQADSAKAQDPTHQMEAEQTKHDDRVASAPSELAAGEMHAANGYGDQSDVLEQRQSRGESGDSHREATGVEDETALTENITGAPEIDVGDPDASSYPDPSVFIRQRISMGYYEQDDTPDKILFDPYQAPPADVLKSPESDVPEFVKKSIRAAKRKARRENEDPEFVIGRSHLKKPRLAQQPDLLESMDPALFEASEVQEVPVNEPREEAEARSHDAPESLQDNPDRGPQRRQTMPVFDANEPILRHAKPKASYVEMEDAELEDFEEENPDTRPAPPTGLQTEEGRDDRDDRADPPEAPEAAAQDTVVPPAQPLPHETASVQSPPVEPPLLQARKRRGRPPKRKSMPAHEGDLITGAPPAAPAQVQTVKRGRGRPRKLVNTAVAESWNDEKSADASMMMDELAAEPTREKSVDANPEPATRRRTRQSGVTTIAAAETVMDLEPEPSMVDSSPRPVPSPSPKKRRGRPRRSEVLERKASVGKEVAIDQKFMSMSERMALRGRSFRIGKRRPRGSVSATVSRSMTPAEVADDALSSINVRQQSEDTRQPSPEDAGDDVYQSGCRAADAETDHSSSPGPSPALRSMQRGISVSGPTVVRLADVVSESEKDTTSEESSSSAFDSGDDGDIPSHRLSLGASRGRGTPRGRRGFRGRRGTRGTRGTRGARGARGARGGRARARGAR